MSKCIFCKREMEKKGICPRCASIIKDIVLALVVTIVGVAYIVSPVDLIPEAILGLVGLGDDGVTFIGIIVFDVVTIASIIRKST